jgi:TIR domain
MSHVFVSYRNLDSIDITTLLYDRLTARFGKSKVFLDYERLKGGQNFLTVIDEAVDSATVLLSVIGPKWKGDGMPGTVSRLDDPKDVVRRELERAQRRKVPILPVLIGGLEKLPEDLPQSLTTLKQMHSLKLRSGLDFETDLRRVLECLERLMGGRFARVESLVASLSSDFSSSLNHEVGSRRASMLIALRSGVVISAIGAVSYVGRTLFKANAIESLPSFTLLAAATLAIAAVGVTLLVLSWLRLRLVTRLARRRQELALKELSAMLLKRLETSSLLSAVSVRGLAVNLEQKHRCPIITDKLIAEAIRSTAITLEYSVRGDELENKLRRLNRLLLQIDESASPMCSIAVVDRLAAYVQSQPVLAGLMLLVFLIVTFGPIALGRQWSLWMLMVAAGASAIAFLLWLWTERAIRYWRDHSEDVGDQGARTEPGLLTDFFLRASCSRARWAEVFWHLQWGPIWEQVMFVWRNENELIAMHECRLDVARELWKEMKATDIDLEQVSNRESDPVLRAILEQRFRELARKLWVVTGESQFRTIEARGTIVREDRSHGILAFL